ncbi:outer membrane family protein [uncultured Helicobacter sp.]|uniref:outer membrane family protein n=1 Tax=uncultured Helicobacter sp. TaxID=175537 RepID=UPI00262D61AB|nr:outer membrane family protein [uncultured Helicobacter sp.]
MKKIVCIGVLVWGCLLIQVNAFEVQVNGSAETFTKWGFNNQKLNQATGAAPTESFTTLFSQLNLEADLGAGFKAGLGGAIGGLVFDSTAGLNSGVGNASPVQQGYFGLSWDKERIQNYIVHNAFLEYKYADSVYLKAGRYEGGKVGEWYSGYTQGAEGYIQFKHIKIWGFLSNRRGFAYDQWFNDFYRVSGTYSNGATRNTYAAGLDLSFAGFSVSGFSYYIPGVVTAPGVSLTFDSNPNFEAQGFRSVSKVRTLFPIAADGQWGSDKSVRGGQWVGIEHHSATLIFEQKFELDNFHFGAGYYQNFGNASALIGSWGSPLMLDIWTASAWDIGPALADIISKNAITGFGFLGANYAKFDWQFIARATNSTRSAEQSVALHLKYQVREDVSVGGKLEWFSDTTKAGYNPLAGYYTDVFKPTHKRIDDRSHLFFYIRHTI